MTLKCTENEAKPPKALHMECQMYRKRHQTEPQIPLEEFYMAFGGRLSKANRWVKLAHMIPWDEVEKRYAAQFKSTVGNPAYSVRVAFGSLVIKEKLKITDDETVEQIRENPYLQYFIGYDSYRDEPPFNSSTMVYFRLRLKADIIKEINDLIIERAEQEKRDAEAKKGEKNTTKKDNDQKDPPQNSGTLLMDSTCIPEDIRYPHDVTLLDEARRKTEKIIDTIFEKSDTHGTKPRTYRKKARKEFLRFIKNKKRNTRDFRKALKQQAQYVSRNLRTIEKMAEKTGLCMLSRKLYRDLLVISEVTRQQKEMLANNTRSIPGKLMSIWKPHVRAIARGKAKAMYEYGAKISLSLVDGYARVDRLSWDHYNEVEDLQLVVLEYKRRYGFYPEVVCADKIYRSRDNLDFCKRHGIRLSGPKLGRPPIDIKKKREITRSEQKDERMRIPIEGKIGEGKRCYTLDRLVTKLEETSKTSIMMSFIVMNLARWERDRARSLLFVIFIFLQIIRREFWNMLAENTSNCLYEDFTGLFLVPARDARINGFW
jgi:IS5 family transposase